MEFLCSLFRRRFAMGQVATSRNVGCFLRLSMKLNWNFQRGVGVQTKNPPWEEYGYFQEQHIWHFTKTLFDKFYSEHEELLGFLQTENLIILCILTLRIFFALV